MALLPDTGNFIFGTFGDSIFVFPLQLSLLCFAYFFFVVFFFLFSSLLFISCVSPSPLLPLPASPTVRVALRLHPLEGDRHLPAPGVPVLPRGGTGPGPRLRAGQGRRGRLLPSVMNPRLLPCGVRVISAILRNKREVAGGTVLFGGTEKVVAC